jgi:uncharacterized lipoprotein YajG
MKKLLIAACCLFTLAGCANEYIIATNDGKMITASEKPVLDEDTEMLHFQDEEGRDQQIQKSQVKQMIER